MPEIDLFALLPDLGRSIERVRSYLLARRDDPQATEQLDPYEATRSLSGHTTYQALCERSHDPAAPYLCAWVYALLQGRVNGRAEVASLIARTTPVAQIALATPETLSIRTCVKRLVAEPIPERRAVLANAFCNAPQDASSLSLELWARRGEVSRRLGLEDADTWISPLKEPKAIAPSAAQVLETTEEHLRSLRNRNRNTTWFDTLALGSAVNDEIPWPKHLTARWLLEPFRNEAGWLHVPDLQLGSLCPLLTGASFSRAFARLGARWADASRSRALPTALAQLPSEMPRRTLGVTFVSLLLCRPFLTRALGFTRTEAERVQRSQACVLLIAWRLAAARILIRPYAFAGNAQALQEAAEEHFGSALQSAYPSALALVLPRLRLTDPARLLAFGEGVSLAQTLQSHYDEDWYRNPRAVLFLRDQLERAPALHTPLASAQEGASQLASLLAGVLG